MKAETTFQLVCRALLAVVLMTAAMYAIAHFVNWHQKNDASDLAILAVATLFILPAIGCIIVAAGVAPKPAEDEEPSILDGEAIIRAWTISFCVFGAGLCTAVSAWASNQGKQSFSVAVAILFAGFAWNIWHLLRGENDTEQLLYQPQETTCDAS